MDIDFITKGFVSAVWAFFTVNH